MKFALLIAAGCLLAAVLLTPQLCGPDSPPGPTIGGAILLYGCPR